MPAVLAAIPAGYRALVVDNNSTDDTAEVGRRHGAEVVFEPSRDTGRRCTPAVVAASTPVVAVLDGDGSLDPGELPGLVADLDRGADMAIGRRRPVPGLTWPWHARMGTAAVCWRLRTRHGLAVHDIAPMRVARRDAIVGPRGHRSTHRATRWNCWCGLPTRTGAWSSGTSATAPGRAASPRSADRCGAVSLRPWTFGGRFRDSGRRAGGGQGAGARARQDAAGREHRSRGGRRRRRGGTARHPRCGGRRARSGAVSSPSRGTSRSAARGSELNSRLCDFTVVGQRGADFAERLVHAHADASEAVGGLPVLQIGMDTPQVTPQLIEACARALLETDAVLGMARDGGWWVLGVTDSGDGGLPARPADVPTRYGRCNACRAYGTPG